MLTCVSWAHGASFVVCTALRPALRAVLLLALHSSLLLAATVPRVA